MKRILISCCRLERAHDFIRAQGVSPHHPMLVYLVGRDDLFKAKLVNREGAAWVDLHGGWLVEQELRVRLGEPLDAAAMCWALKQVAA